MLARKVHSNPGSSTFLNFQLRTDGQLDGQLGKMSNAAYRTTDE